MVLQGRVKNETGTHVQMELEAISGRVVTVDKKYLPAAFGGGMGEAPGRWGPQGSATSATRALVCASPHKARASTLLA